MLTSAAAGRKGPGAARAVILRVVRRLYVANGASGVSARKIARELGCSPTAIYLYYRSIPALLEELRMEGHAILTRRLQEAAPDAEPLERLLAMGRAYFAFGRDHPSYYALMFSVRPADLPRREAVQREMRTLLVVRDVVQAGIQSGALRRGDPTVIANSLWAQVHGVTALAVSGLLFESAEGHDREVLETVLGSGLQALRR